MKLVLVLSLAALVACTQESPAPTPPPAQTAKAAASGRRVDVKVTDSGYEPAQVTATKGEQVTLVFTRVSEGACGAQLVIPAQKVQRDLPLNQPVEVSITASEAGTIAFACGMDMMRGSIVVQ